MLSTAQQAPRVQIVNTASLRGQMSSLVSLPEEAEALDDAARTLPVDKETLRRCVGDEEPFIADVWGKRAQVVTQGIPASDLIDVSDIDRMLTSQPLLRAELIRLVRKGDILPRGSYLRSLREVYPRPVDHRMTEVERTFEDLTHGIASPAEVTAAVRGGATLILQSAHWYHPPLTAFCRSLELALGHRCRANIYLTPGSAQGFGLHSDPHDVFVLQAFGEKNWHLEATPWERQHRMEPGLTDLVLRPGDVLYMPQGTPHRAHTQSGQSGHVTISVTSNTWRDVLRTSLLELLEESLPAEQLDAELPVGWLHDRGSTTGPTERLMAGLRTVLDDADSERIRSAHLRTFLTELTDRIPGAFATDHTLGFFGVNDTTRLRRQETVPCALFRQPETRRLHVVLGRRTVTVPDHFGSAVRHIAACGEFQPQDLSFALDVSERLELCQALVDAHLLLLA
ncbi:cupin domain-containing protein [Streptomyces sp. NPDC005485]|uniref:JmjC domain-containing protein n=1 Tax=Streptomyces sp. NPDC005485 TaxID=3155591 RepID=UPI0033A0EDD8